MVDNNISKTVRIPSDLVDFINQQEGTDFTKRLVTVLMFAKDGDALHRITIDSYNDAVERQKKLLVRLTDLEATLTVLDQLTVLIKDLVKELQRSDEI